MYFTIAEDIGSEFSVVVGWRFPDAFMSEGDGIGLEEEWQGQGKSVCYLVFTCVWGRGNAVHRTGVGGGKSSAACSLVPSSFHLQTSMSIVNPFHFSFNDKFTDLLLYTVEYRRLLLSDVI